MSPMPAGGGTKARARQEAQRARILEAARKCFSEQGFHGAGMSAIAREAAKALPIINDPAINDRSMSFILFSPFCRQLFAGPLARHRPPSRLNS